MKTKLAILVLALLGFVAMSAAQQPAQPGAGPMGPGMGPMGGGMGRRHGPGGPDGPGMAPPPPP